MGCVTMSADQVNMNQKTLNTIEEIYQTEITNFTQLCTLANLDPSIDFINSNLEGVNFDFCDLQGYNFTGANLKNTTGIGVRWNSSTIFKDAIINNSIFEFRVNLDNVVESNEKWKSEIQRMKKASIYEISNWGENNKFLIKNTPEMTAVAMKLFFELEDPSARSEFLYVLRWAHNDPSIYRNFLFQIVSDLRESKNIILSAINLISRVYYYDKNSSILFYKLSSLKEVDYDIKQSSIRGILYSRYAYEYNDVLSRNAIFFNRENRNRYIYLIARHLGSDYIKIISDKNFKSNYLDYANPIGGGAIRNISTRLYNSIIDGYDKIINDMRIIESERNKAREEKEKKLIYFDAEVKTKFIEIKKMGVPIKFI